MKQPEPIDRCWKCCYVTPNGYCTHYTLEKQRKVPCPRAAPIPDWCPLPDAISTEPNEDQMTDLERSIWSTVHMWADGQAGEIPDMNRRHLMDLIMEIVKKYSE